MKVITLDDVARLPRPGMAVPASYAFSPDGSMLTYLHAEEGSLRRTLQAMDVATGERRVLFDPATAGYEEGAISHDEAMRRERRRMLATGVTHYRWAERAPVMLVPLPGTAWVVSADGDARPVVSDALDPAISPDGARVAFVRGGELWVCEVSSGEETRLTHDAADGVTNGTAEYVAQEELGRTDGFWWDSRGEWLAYEQVDERHIPEFVIPHWGTGDVAVERHRYPFAGSENARWRIGVVRAEGGETRWLDVPDDAEYLARVAWHPDGRLFVQTLTRDQRRLELRAYDPASGDGSTLLVEESDVWVNLHNDLRFVPKTGEFIWSSERTGFRQLYLYGSDGALVRALTEVDGMVDGVLGVDVEGRRVAFAAASPTPIEAHVFIASLDGGEPERLTHEPGSHLGMFSRDLGAWVHAFHSTKQPPRVTVRAHEDHPLHEPPQIDLVPPQLFSFTNRHGDTLHGAVFLPATLPAPAVVRVYGGPHAQMVTDSWTLTADVNAQYLAQEGFVTFWVDNRGSWRRGLAFEGALNRRMGTVEVDDQVDGVRYARAQGWIDGDRVGITGWSYGGYMTIMSMLKAPDVFRVGVAGAPVTSWDGYDTAYTERYMDTPEQNPDGYRDASALTHAANLRGKLLMIHGMLDENVHVRHTARFLEACSKANRHVDLMLYPSERHSPRSEADRRNMHERIVSYFKEHL